MSGYVYLITTADAERVKIGFTRSWPEARLKDLQTGSPLELCIVATMRGTTKSERALHQRFADYRVHGEWFERCPEMDQLIHEMNVSAFEHAKRLGQPAPHWASVWCAAIKGSPWEAMPA